MNKSKQREQEAIEFLRELGKGLPSDHRVLVVYADDATIQRDPKTGKKINSAFWPAVHRDGDYIKSESNAYACISSAIKAARKSDGKMRYWRSEQNFGAGQAFFVDDIGEGKGSKGGMSLENWLKRSEKVPPTAIVETSPNNYQCWYFFEEPIKSMGNFKSFLYSFVNSILEGAGGDVTIKDVTRVGRMPYGINNKRNSDGSFKYVDENGNPFRVRLHSADYSRRYTMEGIAAAFKFNIIDHASTIRRTDADEEAAILAMVLKEIEKDGSDSVKGAMRAKMDMVRQERELNKLWFDIAWKELDEARYGEGENGHLKQNDSGKIRIRCPLGHEHTNGDPYGAYFRDHMPGAEHEYVAGCAHDVHRKEKGKFTWATFVDVVVMPGIFDDLEIANITWAQTDEMPREG